MKYLYSDRFRSYFIYSGQAFLIIIILIILLDLINKQLDIPFVFSGDAMHHLMVTKAIIQNGWWWHIDQLGAPFGLPMIAFPVGGNLDYAIIKIISLFSDKPEFILNVFWLFTFILTGWSALWAFTHLGLPKSISVVLGILYAFLPAAFFRNTSHLHSLFYLIPIICYISVSIITKSWSEINSRERLFLIGVCIAIGFNYIYTAFFSCFFLLISALVCLFLRDKRKNALLATVAIVLISGTALLNLVPTIIAWNNDPQIEEHVNMKVAAEADIHGLKIRQLLIPSTEHFFSPFRDLANKTISIQFPLEHENTFAKLGTIGSIGFLFLIVVVLFLSLNTRNEKSPNTINTVAVLSLAGVLLATIGGFGSIFNILTPHIRAYNRISPFIAFFSFYAFGHLIWYLEKRAQRTPLQRIYFYLCLAGLLIFGILDQKTVTGINEQYKSSLAEYDSYRPYFSKIEAMLPKEAKIFQLPFVEYPNTPTVIKMYTQDQIKPYILTRDLHFSLPVLTSKGWNLYSGIQTLSPDGMLDTISAIGGFDGILIDRFGYRLWRRIHPNDIYVPKNLATPPTSTSRPETGWPSCRSSRSSSSLTAPGRMAILNLSMEKCEMSA